MTDIKAIIADDEEQLRLYLKSKLTRLWPELDICGVAQNGLEALEMIENMEPDLAFLDIKMPGLSGIEVAGKITGNCRVVFITAYDQYAVEAFEKEAVDYLLKPVTDERLAQTVSRLQKQILSDNQPAEDFGPTLERLLVALKTKEAKDFLKWIKVRHQESINLVAVEDVYYFKAEDKYTVVKTPDSEYLIKKSIRQLTEELDPDQFWRIHRGTLVNVRCIDGVHRSFAGRLLLKLKDLPETLPVSKSYTHLFKQM